jgi:abequosyltransferase
MNTRLSIVIPSYNRAELLKNNLLEIQSDLIEHSIGVYISDDSTDDRVTDMYRENFNSNKNIFYSKNEPGLGHDKNYFHSLSLPDTDYVWVIGDSICLKKGAIKKVLDTIQSEKPDIISVNSENRGISIDKHEYTDTLVIFEELGWHLTYTGTSIFSKNAIDSSVDIDINYFNNFPQIALIFNHLKKGRSFHWINQNLIYSNNDKTSYWHVSTFKTFINDWENAIYGLPHSYPLDLKEKVILKHSLMSGLFSIRSLAKMRLEGVYSIDTLVNYRSRLIKHSKLSYPILFIIAILPRGFLSIVSLLYSNFVK